MIEVSTEIAEYLLAFADDEHLMGQQYTEWVGITPFLEEDLAFSSIGQDELGHAAMLYALLAGDDDVAIDRLAFLRPAEEFRSCWLTEQAAPEWADAIVRHWLYDSVEKLRWELIAESSIPELADVAARAQREETFHFRHADSLLSALLSDAEAESRLRAAVTRLLPLALGLFDGVRGEAQAVASGVASGPLADHLDGWKALVDERFGPQDWSVSEPPQNARTVRSDDFAPLLAKMCEVFDYDPEAVW